MCVCVCVRARAHGLNDCKEWKKKKCCESTDVGKLRTTRTAMAAENYVTSGARLTKFQAAGIWLGRAYRHFIQCFLFRRL